MQDRETTTIDQTAGERSPEVAAPGLGTEVREETPDAPEPPDPEAAEPSAMVEEGERPAPDRRSGGVDQTYTGAGGRGPGGQSSRTAIDSA